VRIRVGYELTYECAQPTFMILMLNVHYSRAPDLELPDHIITAPPMPLAGYRDSFGNWCTRIVAPAGRITISADAVVRDGGEPDAVPLGARQTPVEQLPDDALIFLLPSRYCETDRLMDTAWAHFGTTPAGWPRVQAICDYVHARVKFGYQHASVFRTAHGAHEEMRGVCRDFAHLALTLCRCMNIPARYCTGYLGDIGVPPSDSPMDFSGWFEVFLDGQWHTVDARHNTPRIGRILIARGRDAADVAISTTFGPNRLTGFKVWTDAIDA
jgi:transglutaminase-like putative cysteine protease